ANGSVQTQSGWCLDDGGSSAVLASCANTPSQSWELFSNGQFRGAENACLTVNGTTVALALWDADRSASLYLPLAAHRWAQHRAGETGWSAAGQFSDSEVPAALAYAGTLRLADVNGDGYLDACIRLSDGVHCALNQGNGTFAPHTLWSADFSDSKGWSVD